MSPNDIQQRNYQNKHHYKLNFDKTKVILKLEKTKKISSDQGASVQLRGILTLTYFIIILGYIIFGKQVCNYTKTFNFILKIKEGN